MLLMVCMLRYWQAWCGHEVAAGGGFLGRRQPVPAALALPRCPRCAAPPSAGCSMRPELAPPRFTRPANHPCLWGGGTRHSRRHGCWQTRLPTAAPCCPADPLEIAYKELREKVIPFTIRRYLPDGSYEDHDLKDLIIPER